MGSAFDGAPNTGAWVFDRDHHALLGAMTIGLCHSRLLIIVYASAEFFRVAAYRRSASKLMAVATTE
jgi:hypothetical protein